ncbi:MAG TPA: hypothetical protein PLC40_08570, partial [Candidatus Hydrogenedentes bacterium]|nr:hypothetical protein [Candidatus Hydrogenedentota bacterium]
MSDRLKVLSVLASVAILGLCSGMANACPYKDSVTGEPLIAIGGEAVADAIGVIDPPSASNYTDWDVNEDGIKDAVQFALLTELLCLDPSLVHEYDAILLQQVQDQFETNLALMQNLRAQANDTLPLALAAAPLAVAVSNQMKAPENAAALAGPIEAVAFTTATVPANWAGNTYADLANFLFKSGDGVIYHDAEGNIDTAVAAADNDAAACLAAAGLGFATPSNVADIMANIWYKRVERGVALKNLDWDYLASKFALDANDVADIQGLVADQAAIGPDAIPTFDAGDFVAIPALNADFQWGAPGETLGSLITTYGGDVAAIWEYVLPYFEQPLFPADYCDAFSDPSSDELIFNVGGKAVADAIALIDTGNEVPQYHDYYSWDLNEDGIADHVQFGLLAKLLCIDNLCLEHPYLDLDAVRAAWELNLGTADAGLSEVLQDVAVARAAAQTVVDVTNAIKLADPSLRDVVIEAGTFGGAVPAEWAGKTYGDLANFLYDTAREVVKQDGNGNIDTALAALDNTAAKMLGGAVASIADQEHVDWILNNIWYARLIKGLKLRDLNWADLQARFSLDSVAVTAIVDAVNATTTSLDSAPEFGVDFEGIPALAADAQWTEDYTLADLIEMFGNDVEGLWVEMVQYELTEKNCDDSNACTEDSCDPLTGDCAHTAINCDDGNPCTTDSCDPATGCVNEL